MRALLALIVLVGALTVAGTASAICVHTSVKGLDGRCLDPRCPPGTTAYMATIENDFPEQLYITYAFRRPDGAIITAGLTLDQGVSRLPIGIGPVSLPVGEGYDKRLGRLRILECGVDPGIIFKWRRK